MVFQPLRTLKAASEHYLYIVRSMVNVCLAKKGENIPHEQTKNACCPLIHSTKRNN